MSPSKIKALAALSNAVLHSAIESGGKVGMTETIKEAMTAAIASGATVEEIKDARVRGLGTAQVFSQRAARKAPAVPKAPKRAKAKIKRRR